MTGCDINLLTSLLIEGILPDANERNWSSHIIQRAQPLPG